MLGNLSENETLKKLDIFGLVYTEWRLQMHNGLL